MNVIGPTTNGWEPGGRTASVLLLLIVCLAAALRFLTLGHASIWLDEAVSWQQSNSTLRQLISSTAADNYPPLHNLALWVTIKLFGDSEFALRLPSAVAGVLTCAAVYWVGAMLGGRKAGLLAAVVLALSGFHIFYSQDARQYAFLGLFATLFAGTSIRFLEEPTRRWGLMSVLAGTALVYSHYYGVLGWLSIGFGSGLAVLFSPLRRQIWKWALVQLAIGVLFSPWLLIFLRRARHVAAAGFWAPRPTFQTLSDDLSRITAGQTRIMIIGIALALVMLGLWNKKAWVLWTWAVLPIAMGVLVSIVVQPVFIARYGMVSLPAMVIALSVGFAAIAWQRKIFAVVAIALIASSLLTISHWYGAREDWRGIAARLQQDMHGNDCLLVAMNYYATPLNYYQRVPPNCFSALYRPTDLQLASLEGRRVFLLLKDVQPPMKAAVLTQISSAHKQTAQASFAGGVDLLEFDPVATGAATGQ
ncbi:MAG: hypothetical protein JWN11_1672 [Hyphomicrobiales bacterium]|nr:hypothetical protein [Hyphomicrobiales bacterium]